MDIRKGMLIIFIACMIVGCAPNQSSEKNIKQESEKKIEETTANLYKGLDAKETYEKACSYFSENVTYVKEIFVEENGKYTRVNSFETFINDGRNNGIIISKFAPMSQYEVYLDEKYFAQVNSTSSDLTTEEQKKQYSSKQKAIFIPLTKKEDSNDFKTEVIDIKRIDEGEEIIINIKYKTMSASTSEDGKKEWNSVYRMQDMYINDKGLFYKVDGKTYDKSFNKAGNVYFSKFIDINERKSFNFDKEVENVKEYENMSVEEFRKELGV